MNNDFHMFCISSLLLFSPHPLYINSSAPLTVLLHPLPFIPTTLFSSSHDFPFSPKTHTTLYLQNSISVSFSPTPSIQPHLHNPMYTMSSPFLFLTLIPYPQYHHPQPHEYPSSSPCLSTHPFPSIFWLASPSSPYQHPLQLHIFIHPSLIFPFCILPYLSLFVFLFPSLSVQSYQPHILIFPLLLRSLSPSHPFSLLPVIFPLPPTTFMSVFPTLLFLILLPYIRHYLLATNVHLIPPSCLTVTFL